MEFKKEDTIEMFRQFRFYRPEYQKVVDDILNTLQDYKK